MSPQPSPPPPPPPEYTSILAFFYAHSSTPAEISCLPSPEILTSGPHIGIPKPCLINAFTHARTIFSTTHDAPSLLDATTILILTVSEHHTAISARKRALLSSQLSPTTELIWLQSLLTSPLPAHNKSPLLWAHRRWVFETFPQHQHDADVEMAVVLKSAEAHPRNYYAWDHARWVVRTLPPGGEALLERHLGFCWTHPADCGVWGFLGVLMGACAHEERKEALVREVVGFSRVAPGHESLWVFVRTVVGREGALGREARGRLRAMLEDLVAGSDSHDGSEEMGRERELRSRALKWVDRFGNLRENDE